MSAKADFRNARGFVIAARDITIQHLTGRALNHAKKDFDQMIDELDLLASTAEATPPTNGESSHDN